MTIRSRDLRHGEGAGPLSSDLVCSFLQGCTRRRDIVGGRQLFDLALKCGFDSVPECLDHAIRLFTSCGSLVEANIAFQKSYQVSAYTWNAIIAAHVKLGHPHSALALYKKMQIAQVRPDRVTFLLILKSCTCLETLTHGRAMHDSIIYSGSGYDQIIGNSLLDMYAKCGSLAEAHKIFDGLPCRDVVSWGTIMGGYVQHGYASYALEFVHKMQQEGLEPDRVILICTLKACGIIGNVWQGKLAHNQAVKEGFEVDVVLESTLIDMYCKCACMEDGKRLFDKVPMHNIVSWGAIIGGYSDHGFDCTVLELYVKLQEEGLLADRAIFLCVLKACSNSGAVEQGRLIEEQIRESGLVIDVIIGTSIVEMYARCGDLDDAQKVLMDLQTRNAIAWGSMIAGYVAQGDCKMADWCLQAMREEGLALDPMVFTHILTSCSHGGLLREGCVYFNSMMTENIRPTVDHYTCMVDLLGRVGCLEEAACLLETMPTLPDMVVWRSLLTACKVHCNVEVGKRCLEHLNGLDPLDGAGYTLMSGIYGAAYMWEDAEKVEELRVSANAPKKPGRALIEVKNTVYGFDVGDEFLTPSSLIYGKLKVIFQLLKHEGYMPQASLVLEIMSGE